MSTMRLRPRFRKIIPLAPEQVIRNIRKAIKDPKNGYSGSIVDNHIILTVPKEEQHYWSPQLSLELEPDEAGTLLRGMFGPKPTVWTMFMFFYSGVGFFTLMGLMWGISQWMIGQKPSGLLAVLAGVLILVLIFIIASMGKAIGRKQMQSLNDFFVSIVDEPTVKADRIFKKE